MCTCSDSNQTYSLQGNTRHGETRHRQEDGKNYPEKSDKIVMNGAKYFCWNLILFSELLRISRASTSELSATKSK